MARISEFSEREKRGDSANGYASNLIALSRNLKAGTTMSPRKPKLAKDVDIFNDGSSECSVADSDSECSILLSKTSFQDQQIRKKQVRLGPFGLGGAAAAPIELDTSMGFIRSPQKAANERATKWRRELEAKNTNRLDLDAFLKIQPSLAINASPVKKPLFRKLDDGNSRETTHASFLTTDTDASLTAGVRGIDASGDLSDQENLDPSVLKFSPARGRSKPFDEARARTPSPFNTPSKRLLSPTKKPSRVPTPPGRPSLDNFWDAEAVNEWNDQHSPRKQWSKNRAEPSSPTSSPKKLQSPSKKSKAEIQARKDWDLRKHDIAMQFLEELDQKVSGGQIAELSASTGGVKIIWSKTLNSTAGRANWKRETTKTETKDDNEKAVTPTYQHFASIELAEKVIDDEGRLLNVLAHEFCHLCNFMISGIKDQPHGAQFKKWGKKTTTEFAHRDVMVTTKHSYQIDYKYIWQCSNLECATEFKRHSRSIDPKRQTCGSCRSQLLQTKPVPRKAGTSLGNVYAGYVKLHFAKVRRDMPGASQKQVMEAVAKQYHAQKAQSVKPDSEAESMSSSPEPDLELASIAEKLGSVALDD